MRSLGTIAPENIISQLFILGLILIQYTLFPKKITVENLTHLWSYLSIYRKINKVSLFFYDFFGVGIYRIENILLTYYFIYTLI